MNEKRPWPNILRNLHLPGGLRVAEISIGKALLHPIGKGESTHELQISSFEEIGQDIFRCTALPVLGCEFIKTSEEIDGLSQPEWRAVTPSKKNEWPSRVADMNWAGLEYAAYKRKDWRLFLMAGSIKSQGRFSEMRLLDLSERYLRTLTSLLKLHNELSSECHYRNTLSVSLYASIYASFFEIATLRDYLAEYIAYVVYGNEKIDTFSKLRDFVAKKGCTTALEKQIYEISFGDGWVKVFSDMRNTLAHRVPFNRLAGRGAMHLKELTLSANVKAWMLHLPLPAPVPFNYKSRFNLPDNETELATMRINESREGHMRKDTLTYLFDVFRNLIEFTNSLTETFPYEPEMFTITDEMILAR